MVIIPEIVIKYKEHTWCELPWYKFYMIPGAIKNLVGNTEGWFKRIKYIKFTRVKYIRLYGNPK